MPSRDYPGLGLAGDWDEGEDGWKPGMDSNLLKLSVLTQGKVLSRVTTLPGSPTEGMVYIVPSGGDANKVAVYDEGAWVYFVPVAGWVLWVADESKFYYYTGSAWSPLGSSTSAWDLVVAASDETTVLTTGNGKITFPAPRNVTITDIFIFVTTAPGTGSLSVDVKKNGTTMLSTLPVIVAGQNNNLAGGGTLAVISSGSWTKGDAIRIDISAVGTLNAGLKVVFVGTPA